MGELDWELDLELALLDAEEEAQSWDLYSDQALELEEQGWEIWLRTLFPQYVNRGFAKHHREFWDWAWAIDEFRQPDPFLEIWPRGHGKSTSVELLSVACGARRKRRYVLYFSGTQEQADGHVATVGSMLESPQIAEYYPDLGNRKVGKYGTAKSWRRERLWTASGFVIDALGLDTAARGIKVEERRPDLIIIDDIDGENDSLKMVGKKIRMLARKILPSGSPHRAVCFAQNLIHRHSVIHQVMDGRAEILAGAIKCGPIPALRNFAWEKQEREGRVYYAITSGIPTWDGFGLEACEAELNLIGPTSFQVELQHKVNERETGALFEEFDELIHVITWSEFAEFYGKIARDERGVPRIPRTWQVGRGQDWGSTDGHPCATVWCARPAERDQLNDSVFVYREMIRPYWPPREGERFIVSPLRIAREIERLEKLWEDYKQVELSLMSHEASPAKNTYDHDLPNDLPLGFQKWQAKRGSGVPQIQNYLTIIPNLAHPFRGHLEGFPLGRPRIYFIVADGQGEAFRDPDTNDWLVKQPVDELGQIRGRWEIPRYALPKDADGEEVEREPKKDDDYVDALRGLAAKFFPTKSPLTEQELLDKKMPKGYQQADIAAMTPEERTQKEFGYFVALGKARQKLRERMKPRDSHLVEETTDDEE